MTAPQWIADLMLKIVEAEEIDLDQEEMEALEDGGAEIEKMLRSMGFDRDPIRKGRWARVTNPI